MGILHQPYRDLEYIPVDKAFNYMKSVGKIVSKLISKGKSLKEGEFIPDIDPMELFKEDE